MMKNLEVLNIANTNSKGDIVLNDDRLLKLIQLYPFLYYHRVRPHNDPDYNDWAWNCITKAFNEGYKPDVLRTPFTTEQLQERWGSLQHIVKSLSLVQDINAVSESLRQSVTKITYQLSDTTPLPNKTRTLTIAQSIIMDNISMVESLPIEDRRRLEVEFMNYILSFELATRGTVKLGPKEMERIDKECEDFCDAIRLKEVEAFLVMENSSDTPNDGNVIIEHRNHEVKHISQLKAENNINSEDSEKSNMDIDDLLQPLEDRKWVPLSQWPLYVRNCSVRLKRMNVDDYLPLAKIKREKRW